jgi:predicted transcriptional regulator
MKQFKIDDQKKDINNWILPGNSLSQDEFLSGIKQAEEGPFFTVQESMENFEQWLKSREKK